MRYHDKQVSVIERKTEVSAELTLILLPEDLCEYHGFPHARAPALCFKGKLRWERIASMILARYGGQLTEVTANDKLCVIGIVQYQLGRKRETCNRTWIPPKGASELRIRLAISSCGRR